MSCISSLLKCPFYPHFNIWIWDCHQPVFKVFQVIAKSSFFSYHWQRSTMNLRQPWILDSRLFKQYWQHEFRLQTWIITGLQFKISREGFCFVLFFNPSIQCQGWYMDISFLSPSGKKFISHLTLHEGCSLSVSLLYYGVPFSPHLGGFYLFFQWHIQNVTTSNWQHLRINQICR